MPNVTLRLKMLAIASSMLVAVGSMAYAQEAPPPSTQASFTASRPGTNLVEARFSPHHGGGNWDHHHGWDRGPVLGFGDDVYVTPAYVHANACGYYRTRWHETGRIYWKNRYLDCRYG